MWFAKVSCLPSWLACIIYHLVYTLCSIVYFDSFSILVTHNLPIFLAYSIDLQVAYSNSCNVLCNLYWIPARLLSDTTLCIVGGDPFTLYLGGGNSWGRTTRSARMECRRCCLEHRASTWKLHILGRLHLLGSFFGSCTLAFVFAGHTFWGCN